MSGGDENIGRYWFADDYLAARSDTDRALRDAHDDGAAHGLGAERIIQEIVHHAFPRLATAAPDAR